MKIIGIWFLKQRLVKLIRTHMDAVKRTNKTLDLRICGFFV